jgi:hypothetical protein
MLDVVLDVTEEIDETLGAEMGLEKSSLSFKIAFNTLYEYGIIKENNKNTNLYKLIKLINKKWKNKKTNGRTKKQIEKY